jgi:hypothetical protein
MVYFITTTPTYRMVSCLGFKFSCVSSQSPFLRSRGFVWIVPVFKLPVYLPFYNMTEDRPDDGGRKDLWNVGKLLPDYTVLQPRRQPSSYSPPWEPQILLWLILDCKKLTQNVIIAEQTNTAYTQITKSVSTNMQLQRAFIAGITGAYYKLSIHQIWVQSGQHAHG